MQLASIECIPTVADDDRLKLTEIGRRDTCPVRVHGVLIYHLLNGNTVLMTPPLLLYSDAPLIPYCNDATGGPRHDS